MQNYLPANYAFWDRVNEFNANEAAWLWFGYEPLPEHPPAKIERIRCLITSDSNPRINPNYHKNFIKPDVRDVLGYPAFTRESLIIWAERNGHKPLFLFPDDRPSKEPGLSLESSLQVIAALAKAFDPRWEPGKAAPHGMAKRIVTTAETLNLQLDRNTIGKYLKEAGNKIKSA